MDPSWELYFDNAATTRLDPCVLDAMLPYLREDFGNSESLHSLGIQSKGAIERAQHTIAELLGAEDPSQIVFVSGATEANNLVFAQNSGPDAISSFEHSSVRVPALAKGAALLSDPSLISEPIHFLSWMTVNNETGQTWDVNAIATHASQFHTDATQSVFKYPLKLEGIDFLSGSAHKFHGPKGIGFLYTRSAILQPTMLGGGQQNGLRSGTLPTPLIVGLAEAAKIASEESANFIAHVSKLREIVLEAVLKIPDVRINQFQSQAPHILSLSFLGVEAEAILVDLDAKGISVGTGSACSSKSKEPSPVLEAMHLPEVWQRGTVRISFSKDNSVSSTAYLAKILPPALEKARQIASKC